MANTVLVNHGHYCSDSDWCEVIIQFIGLSNVEQVQHPRPNSTAVLELPKMHGESFPCTAGKTPVASRNALVAGWLGACCEAHQRAKSAT